jgi:hypothetical protein
MSHNFELNLWLKEYNIADHKTLGDESFTRGV